MGKILGRTRYYSSLDDVYRFMFSLISQLKKLHNGSSRKDIYDHWREEFEYALAGATSGEIIPELEFKLSKFIKTSIPIELNLEKDIYEAIRYLRFIMYVYWPRDKFHFR